MNKDDDDFVCVRSDNCIYNMPPEFCCKDVACVLPCPQCMCGRKRTDLLNRTFANWDLYNYLSNFPHFIGFPACPLVK